MAHALCPPPIPGSPTGGRRSAVGVEGGEGPVGSDLRAATVIQAAWRGRVCRQGLQRRVCAAVVVQAAWRGRGCRQQLAVECWTGK